MDVVAETLIAVTMILAVCMALAGMRPSSTAQRYRAAMDSYQSRQWPQAFDSLSALADSGDAPAARVAALMAREGPELFGRRFDVSAERLARWDRTMRGRASPQGVVATQQVALAGRTVAMEPSPLVADVPRQPALRR